MGTFKDKFFETSDRPVCLRPCDHPGCTRPGEFRAPKSRNRLNEYYFFCLEHVREYNKAWDFFAGMSAEEIEDYTRDATVWERPTWRLGQWGQAEEKLRAKAFRDIFGAQDASDEERRPSPAQPPAEREALAVLELSGPVTFDEIKKKYRTLVKKHHPDMQGNDKKSEENFKRISLAFATLRKIYAEAESAVDNPVYRTA